MSSDDEQDAIFENNYRQEPEDGEEEAADSADEEAELQAYLEAKAQQDTKKEFINDEVCVLRKSRPPADSCSGSAHAAL